VQEPPRTGEIVTGCEILWFTHRTQYSVKQKVTILI
jgi:hypothetical protein